MDSAPGSVDTRDVVSVCRVDGELNRGLLREMLGYFVDENERRIASLAEAVAATDRRLLSDTAHALRGSAALIGAGRLHDLAWAIESEAANGDVHGLRHTVEAVHQEFAAVVSTLQLAHPEAWAD